MNRSELEKYINKTVEIELFDGEQVKGELHKTGEKQFVNNDNLYIPKNYYFCVESPLLVFRSSHVRRINNEI